VIFVTHEPDIARHTRRVLHIRDGRISQDEAVPAAQRLIARPVLEPGEARPAPAPAPAPRAAEVPA
jgi:hypothetical protein